MFFVQKLKMLPFTSNGKQWEGGYSWFVLLTDISTTFNAKSGKYEFLQHLYGVVTSKKTQFPDVDAFSPQVKG